MDIKNQVCSVEQAVRLKELGINQTKSYFYFYLGDTAVNMDRLLTRVYGSDGTGTLGASAFTVAELGVMINYSFPPINILDFHQTEAEMRADYVIDYLERGIATSQAVNERLAS